MLQRVYFFSDLFFLEKLESFIPASWKVQQAYTFEMNVICFVYLGKFIGSVKNFVVQIASS